MKRTYFLMGILCIGMLVLGVVFAGGTFGMYVNAPALIIVVLLPSFIVSGVFGPRTYFRSFRLAFAGTEATVEELKTGVALFSLLGKSYLLTGFITTMIGIVAILGELKETSELGIPVAIALLTLFYSLILVFLVAAPFKVGHERKLLELEARGAEGRG